MEDNDFEWIGFYEELTSVLMTYKDRQKELISFLQNIESEDIPVILLTDRDINSNDFPLEVIDPFTFFASFNRGIKDTNRILILERVKDFFSLNAEVPKTFNGLPVVNNLPKAMTS